MAEDEACSRNETRLTWNQRGPVGPQGEQGPQGPAGPQGEKGKPGIATVAALTGTPCGEADTGTLEVVFGAGGETGLRCRTGDQMELAVTRAGDGLGQVVSDPIGITCDPACTESFNATDVVTLEARPVGDDVFTGWTGACYGTAPRCTVAMSAARQVGAAFESWSTITLELTVRGDTGTRPGEPLATAHTEDGVVCEAFTVGVTTCRFPVRTGTTAVLQVPTSGTHRGAEWERRDCDEITPETRDCRLTVTGDRLVRVTV